MVDLKEEAMKSCTGCSTTITPLWRGGPAGPKTLCNACGIKYHKKRRALLGEQKKEKPRKKKIKMKNSGDGEIMYGREAESDSVRVPVKIKMVMKKYNRKFGEVEQAALLLMALSYGGCVYS